ALAGIILDKLPNTVTHVGLNFSCDGSHYMPWDEFLEKSLGFWLGTGESIITRENHQNAP
ncbi:hypothetical protein ACFL3A_14800, partial [Pseudomonadota bacterium]